MSAESESCIRADHIRCSFIVLVSNAGGCTLSTLRRFKLIDYVALTEAGTASWDGLEMANLTALDSFETTFGTYDYPQ